MPAATLLRARLTNQALTGTASSPVEVVRRFGAVQAQDYPGALWGIAQRTEAATEADVERAIAAREIVRSWPMRGTLHLVAAEDLRWMLRDLVPRVIRGTAGRQRELGLDGKTFVKAGRVLERALRGGRQLTRAELYDVLSRGRVSPEGQRGIHILGYLAMQGVLCFGPRRGKQPTFALLDEWLPGEPAIERDQALAALARRYFTTHGPATVADFAWWTGLPLGEARAAIAGAGGDLSELVVDGTRYLTGASAPGSKKATAHLLPPYDEYTVAYRDRSAVLDPAHAAATRNGIFAPVVLVDGRVAGTWGRRASKAAIALTAQLLTRTTPAARRLLDAAARRYGEFAGANVTLEIRGPG